MALDRGCPFKLSERPFQPRKAPVPLDSLLMHCLSGSCVNPTLLYYAAIQLSATEKILSKTCQPMSEKCHPVWRTFAPTAL